MQLWQEQLLAEVFNDAKADIGSDAPNEVVEAAAHHLLNATCADPSAEEWCTVPEELSALALQHGFLVLTLVNKQGHRELHLIKRLTRLEPYAELIGGSINDPFEGVGLPDGVSLETVGDAVQLMSNGFLLAQYVTSENAEDIQALAKELKFHGLIY